MRESSVRTWCPSPSLPAYADWTSDHSENSVVRASDRAGMRMPLMLAPVNDIITTLQQRAGHECDHFF
jgi:hypothetical protein